jgi:hypothetical protein
LWYAGAEVVCFFPSVQTIGWHAAKPHAPSAVEQSFALKTTDVTQKEGRNAATYFGYLTML